MSKIHPQEIECFGVLRITNPITLNKWIESGKYQKIIELDINIYAINYKWDVCIINNTCMYIGICIFIYAYL